MVHQLFVRNVDGRTLCLSFEQELVSGWHVREEVYQRTGIVPSQQRIVTGKQEVAGTVFLQVGDDGRFPSCTLLGYVIGGKGGFGSLLRGAASKAGQKKTENFDACRDMSGRRLRHVNAEKKLVEWSKEAGERQLEKVGEAYLKKLAKQTKEDDSSAQDLAQLRQQSAEAVERVADAVQIGMQKVAGKRMVEEALESRKKGKLMSLFEESDGEEDDSDEDEDADYQDQEGTTHSSDGAGPSTRDEQSREDVTGETGPDALAKDNVPEMLETSSPSSDEISHQPEHSGERQELLKDDSTKDTEGNQEACKASVEALAQPSGDHTSTSEPLDLGKFASAKELEALGLERLKAELKKCGLKCGGSLAERASRLYLLKSIPLDKFDKKHFAKV